MRPVCKYYINSECTNPRCKFAHPTQFPVYIYTFPGTEIHPDELRYAVLCNEKIAVEADNVWIANYKQFCNENSDMEVNILEYPDYFCMPFNPQYVWNEIENFKKNEYRPHEGRSSLQQTQRSGYIDNQRGNNFNNQQLGGFNSQRSGNFNNQRTNSFGGQRESNLNIQQRSNTFNDHIIKQETPSQSWGRQISGYSSNKPAPTWGQSNQNPVMSDQGNYGAPSGGYQGRNTVSGNRQGGYQQSHQQGNYQGNNYNQSRFSNNRGDSYSKGGYQGNRYNNYSNPGFSSNMPRGREEMHVDKNEHPAGFDRQSGSEPPFDPSSNTQDYDYQNIPYNYK
ncbi:hypothetical protein GINT2_001426 [Glugoides intestinalis]